MEDYNSMFIPNSFPMPNMYIDDVMPLLTPTEWKVLTYAIRKTLGWVVTNKDGLQVRKSRDRISLTQFEQGIKDRDHGTNMNRRTIRSALDGLIQFNLLVMDKDQGTTVEQEKGTLYTLQLDSTKVDWDGLERRRDERKERFSESMETVRRGSVSHTPPEVIPTRCIPYTTPSVYNTPPPVYTIPTQKETLKEKEIKFAAGAAIPPVEGTSFEEEPNGNTPPGGNGNGNGKVLTHRQEVLKDLETWWAALRGVPVPKRETEKQKKAAGQLWWNPLMSVYTEHCHSDMELTKQVLKEATEKLIKDGMTISDPNSVLKNSVSLAADKNKNGKIHCRKEEGVLI